jgi:hypothetical protein
VQDKDIEVRLEALKLLEPWARISDKSVLEMIQNNKINLKMDHSSWRIRLEELKALMEISHILKKKSAFEKVFKESFLKGI